MYIIFLINSGQNEKKVFGKGVQFGNAPGAPSQPHCSEPPPPVMWIRQYAWLRPGWTILPIGKSYCSNINCARHINFMHVQKVEPRH